jgi:hypothetical protein
MTFCRGEAPLSKSIRAALGFRRLRVGGQSPVGLLQAGTVYIAYILMRNVPIQFNEAICRAERPFLCPQNILISYPHHSLSISWRGNGCR